MTLKKQLMLLGKMFKWFDKCFFEKAAVEIILMFCYRPAYMDEMEKLEEELQSLYEEYMTKYRNVSFLESIYDKYRKYEKDLGDVSCWYLMSLIQLFNLPINL